MRRRATDPIWQPTRDDSGFIVAGSNSSVLWFAAAAVYVGWIKPAVFHRIQPGASPVAAAARRIFSPRALKTRRNGIDRLRFSGRAR